MKQVKKLLVILPLVALFVLGSLPVFAADTEYKDQKVKFVLKFVASEADKAKKEMTYEVPLPTILPEKDWNALQNGSAAFSSIKENLKAYIEARPERDGYTVDEGTLVQAALKIAEGITENSIKAADPIDGTKVPIELKKAASVNNKICVKAYDIFWDEYVPDVLDTVELREGWKSANTITRAYFNYSNLPVNYLYAGFLTVGSEEDEVVIKSMVFNFDKEEVKKTLGDKGAQYITLVVPSYIDVETWHIFPEGTRDKLVEMVPVPFDQWVALQNAHRFMDLNGIFKTRIQKVNEEGYTFKGMKFFDGKKEIVGLLGAYDVFGRKRAGDQPGKIHAEIYYDKAVAAAQEVPTEKKVDAATAPQAQIQAPAAQTPVTAANTTTTTAPVNTLPVTGASDSIFLFLSSAALMAVGILFFKKH